MSLIKCRKCGGPHVTLKCGKEKQDLTTILDEKFTQPLINNNHYLDRSDKRDKRKIITVRISNLPADITVPELNELVSPWGKIGRININNYDNTICYIDFYFKDEAEYFIKAINRTRFDNLIITADIMDKNNN